LERSLVSFDATSARYALHDLMRLVAREAFKYQPGHSFATGSEERLRVAELRMTRHYCKTLATAERLYLQGGDDVKRGLSLFDTEVDGIRHGWGSAARSLAEADYTELARDYALAAPHVAGLRVAERERRELLGQAVEASSWLGDRKSGGWITTLVGETHGEMRQYAQAIVHFERGLAIALETGDRTGEALALIGLGDSQQESGDASAAVRTLVRALEVVRATGNRRKEGQALGCLGRARAALGDVSESIALYEQWLAIAREIGDRWSEGQATGCLGLAYISLGNRPEAIASFERWLAITKEVGYKAGEGAALGNLGHARYQAGDLEAAATCYQQWLAVARQIGDRPQQGDALGNLGRVHADREDFPQSLSCQQQRLAIARETEDTESEGYALLGLARTLAALGQRDDALWHAERSLERLESVRSAGSADARRVIATLGNLETKHRTG
jgi:tetratricopeptide (TPR) repeat protein